MFMRFLSRSLFSSSSGNLDLLSNSRVFFPKLVPSSLLEQMLFCTISLYFFLFSTYHGARLDSHLNLRKYSEPPHPPPLDKISGTVCNFHNKIFLAKFLHYQFWNKIHLYTHIFLFFFVPPAISCTNSMWGKLTHFRPMFHLKINKVVRFY